MSTAAPTAPSQPPLSQGERILDTFVSPSKTFLDLRRSSNWLWPFVIIAIAHILLVVVADQKIGMHKIVENGLRLAPKQAQQLDQLTPEQREAQLGKIVIANKIIWYSLPVLSLIFVAIISGIMLGTMNFGFGATLTFNQCMAVTMYASLPIVIKNILAIVVLNLGAGSDTFIFQNPLASNLSPLVDPSSHFLFSLLVSLDVFTIWTLVLAGIAYACLTKVKQGTTMAVVFGWWALLAVGGAAVSAAFA